ncbi:MAG: FHA domain-containing protein [Thermoleophilia bacterium]
MIACPKCGMENHGDSNFCSRCGSRLVVRDLAETTVTYAPLADEEQPAGAPDTLSGRIATLLIRTGGGREGEQIPLDTDILTIGRNPESHLFLDDVTVSRHHARVIRDATGFVVEDLNSLNGTYVNRGRVERYHLADGDEVQIGKYKLAYLEPQD